jgi:hypothetical protein
VSCDDTSPATNARARARDLVDGRRACVARRVLRATGFALLETALRLVLVTFLVAALTIRLALGASMRFAGPVRRLRSSRRARSRSFTLHRRPRHA